MKTLSHTVPFYVHSHPVAWGCARHPDLAVEDTAPATWPARRAHPSCENYPLLSQTCTAERDKEGRVRINVS